MADGVLVCFGSRLQGAGAIAPPPQLLLINALYLSKGYQQDYP